MCRVATWAKTMRPSATIQVTTIELVTGRPNGRAISTALCESRWCSCASTVSVAHQATATVDVARSSGVMKLRLMCLSTQRDGDSDQDEAEYHHGDTRAPARPPGVGAERPSHAEQHQDRDRIRRTHCHAGLRNHDERDHDGKRGEHHQEKHAERSSEISALQQPCWLRNLPEALI